MDAAGLLGLLAAGAGDMRHQLVIGQVFLAFTCLQAGWWTKDYLGSIAFDWALLSGKFELRPSGVLFLLARFSLTAVFVTSSFLLQNTMAVNCSAVWTALVVLSCISISSSSAIFALRASSVWNHHPALVFVVFSLWVVQCGLWLVDIHWVAWQGANVPLLGHICMPTHFDPLLALAWASSALLDLVVAVLVLLKMRSCARRSPTPFTRLLTMDASIYLLATIPISLGTVVLCVVSSDLLVRNMTLSLTLVCHVALSSRAFMNLHRIGSALPGEFRTRIANGERLDEETLQRLAFRFGAAEVDGVASPLQPSGRELYSQFLSRQDKVDSQAPFQGQGIDLESLRRAHGMSHGAMPGFEVSQFVVSESSGQLLDDEACTKEPKSPSPSSAGTELHGQETLASSSPMAPCRALAKSAGATAVASGAEAGSPDGVAKLAYMSHCMRQRDARPQSSGSLNDAYSDASGIEAESALQHASSSRSLRNGSGHKKM